LDLLLLVGGASEVARPFERELWFRAGGDIGIGDSTGINDELVLELDGI
jgi:hypothetical protein